MFILKIILLIIIGIGIIRVIFAPYKGFVNFLMEIMLLDYLGDLFSHIFDNLDSDDWD